MSDPFIAEVKIFAGTFAPRDWALCDGQLLPIDQNQALFALVGTIYGGDGRDDFALPDMRGRVPVHPGAGPGLTTRRAGEKAGSEDTTLTVANLPAHRHNIQVTSTQGNSRIPDGRRLSQEATAQTAVYSDGPVSGALAANSLTNTGQGLPHTNMPPFLGINFIIALTGIFPSRT